MLERAKIVLLVSLGFGLPWHGALTVFGPDWVRWWKEGALALLFLLVCFQGLKNVKFEILNFKWARSFIIQHSKSPIFYAFLFLLWGGLLLVLSTDLHTSLVALRYLALGGFVFLLGYSLWKLPLISGKNGYDGATKLFHHLCTSLLLGVLTSSLFGLWAKFAGGYQVLSGWYSNTISSWVPGQTLPLYHEAAGFIRLQGASSGPIEYSHLAVMALWYALCAQPQLVQRQWWRLLLWGASVALLLLGIVQSGSRAAALAALILLLGALWFRYREKLNLQAWRWSADKLVAGLLVLIVLVVMVKFTLARSILGDISLLNKNIVRISDVDHIKRPLEAFEMALDSPVTGNLGALGPAARAKNLQAYNNDQAPIAESVPFDVLAQLGVVGFLLWLLFWGFYWGKAPPSLKLLCLAFAPLMLLATIFDMTPLSISFYLVLALGLALPSLKLASRSDEPTVLELKRLAFKTYVEKVWGWHEAEQKQLVKREFDLGGIYLVQQEGETKGTVSLQSQDYYYEVFSFYLHPQHQGAGLGKVLLNQVFPAQPLHLQVLKVNSRAHSFYVQHGFVVTGENQHHYLMKRL